ncbi:WG repeat-containing protein [Lacinutrix neustonica]|uniref:WG repeat-containing protein n=1 Tax=Lacinutrix neustonica TaxID=2980107 RepID=A0A9E8MYD3_9FLAO|nr:WG repeat-containing protein [Lacinutrix neustonica]WAC02787.1 WG repeat-containing protein [Lacinutrix neustonica]
MKKVVLLLIALILIPLFSLSQNLEKLDYISPVHNGLVAIKKDGQWAFIDTQGDLVVDFRTDLVLTTFGKINYPIFESNRCLITQNKDGIPYYGYIDKTGKTVIAPQFLNAMPFNNNTAIALELVKVDLGENEILNKKVYRYKYFEVTIDPTGQIKTYLTDAVYIGLTPSNLLKAP